MHFFYNILYFAKNIHNYHFLYCIFYVILIYLFYNFIRNYSLFLNNNS